MEDFFHFFLEIPLTDILLPSKDLFHLRSSLVHFTDCLTIKQFFFFGINLLIVTLSYKIKLGKLLLSVIKIKLIRYHSI